MWAFRESIPEACARDGKGGNLKYDLSVPVSELYVCVEAMRAKLESKKLYGEESGRVGKVVGFGHMGDGNLHLNITGAAWDKKVLEEVEPFVYEWVQQRNGSISAEHGLGLMKVTVELT
jgi:D-lactate dehydrogenase (cytochrome)